MMTNLASLCLDGRLIRFFLIRRVRCHSRSWGVGMTVTSG
jgi:hypothetical protein